MASLFNLLNSTENYPGHQLSHNMAASKKVLTETTSFTNGNKMLKDSSSVAMKPKGLSMRSQSDLNVRATNSQNYQQDKNIKTTAKLKLSVKSEDTVTTIPTPQNKKKLMKPKSVRSTEPKHLSPSIKSPHTSCFKRPLTPQKDKRNRVVAPEPESLAYYYDQQSYDEIFFKQFSLDKDIKDVILTRQTVKPYTDELLYSDPEEVTLSPNKCTLSPLNSHDFCIHDEPTLPSLSDDDGF